MPYEFTNFKIVKWKIGSVFVLTGGNVLYASEMQICLIKFRFNDGVFICFILVFVFWWKQLTRMFSLNLWNEFSFLLWLLRNSMMEVENNETKKN